MDGKVAEMMKKNMLFRTNSIVCIVIMIGFIITSVVSYFSNRQVFEKDVEEVSVLTSDGIYHEIDAMFTKPVNVSETMANDNLLRTYLREEQTRIDDPSFVQGMQDYLYSYKEKYGYDSVFLISSSTSRYYHFHGIDRIMEKGNEENAWYEAFVNSDEDMSLNIDNDEASENEITVFINCKIYDGSNDLLGVVGVGFRIDTLQELLKNYEASIGVQSYLIDREGMIEVSTSQSGYVKQDLFVNCDFAKDKDRILSTKEAQSFWYSAAGTSGYVVSQYIENLDWYLVIDHNTLGLKSSLMNQFMIGVLVIVAVIAAVLLIITSIIKKYNRQMIDLTIKMEKEHRNAFQEVTEHLYDNIYEFDITHNCPASEETQAYFEQLGVSRHTPYDTFLTIVAKRQIKEEFQTGYLQMFCREHIFEMYERGEDTLIYDFMISNDGMKYHWMRVIARLFTWKEDTSIRMFTYHQNIDEQKKQEQKLLESMEMDSLSTLYNKAATQDKISKALHEAQDHMYVFFILDIDDFKRVNDTYGHAVGDKVIAHFAQRLKQQFSQGDIIGRIGGDEFVVFVTVPDKTWAIQKAASLIQKLQYPFKDQDVVCHISASIGAAISVEDGEDFDTLYRHGDQALYEAKAKGKNQYVFYKK